MLSSWKDMRAARVQIAIEAVLLKIFSKPAQTHERRVIQSIEFRKFVLPAWAQHSVKVSTPYTETNIRDLCQIKLPSGLSPDTDWLLNKIGSEHITSTEVEPKFPRELLLKGPKYPFEPKDLIHLQKKTGTLTGREYTREKDLPNPKNQSVGTRAPVSPSKRARRQLREYQWKIEDDDDNLREDLLAPKYSSF